MDYSFYLNNKGLIDFNRKCLRCSKMCKQSCNVLSMICKHYESQKERIPKEQQIVMFGRSDNQKGSKSRCIKETGLNKSTVYKYWE